MQVSQLPSESQSLQPSEPPLPSLQQLLPRQSLEAHVSDDVHVEPSAVNALQTAQAFGVGGSRNSSLPQVVGDLFLLWSRALEVHLSIAVKHS